jgi:hypothetical protein
LGGGGGGAFWVPKRSQVPSTPKQLRADYWIHSYHPCNTHTERHTQTGTHTHHPHPPTHPHARTHAHTHTHTHIPIIIIRPEQPVGDSDESGDKNGGQIADQHRKCLARAMQCQPFLGPCRRRGVLLFFIFWGGRGGGICVCVCVIFVGVVEGFVGVWGGIVLFVVCGYVREIMYGEAGAALGWLVVCWDGRRGAWPLSVCRHQSGERLGSNRT